MILPIHYIYINNLSVLELCLWINDSGLVFACISRTALSPTYFIYTILMNKLLS